MLFSLVRIDKGTIDISLVSASVVAPVSAVIRVGQTQGHRIRVDPIFESDNLRDPFVEEVKRVIEVACLMDE